MPLKPGDVVVMDNLRSHHVRDVKSLFDEAGIRFLYLPPYSPDLNPHRKDVVKAQGDSEKMENQIGRPFAGCRFQGAWSRFSP